jgi:hypothetical protein
MPSKTPIASFQHGALESRLTWMSPETSLRIWMPAIHAGMTKLAFSFSVGGRKSMEHFIVSYPHISWYCVLSDHC